MKVINSTLIILFSALMLLSLGASMCFGIDLTAGNEGFVEISEEELSFGKVYFIVSIFCVILSYYLVQYFYSKLTKNENVYGTHN